MPISKHFGGHGEEVMRNMKKEYGDKKGESVFYATENKRKGLGPSDHLVHHAAGKRKNRKR